ncbi:unnamed protein product [Cylicostephanus goldi]|uniref:BRO1 domain-containing protein n=1 Tax=Cylicostephanus goldi TaxID=71465 RepID=A0A3P7N5H5_CYLGO|nr:unnamed protein product [Cylicostephanus goldi]
MQHTLVKQCTPDLRAETLSLFCNLMLAQAQECVYTKAYDDKMNTAALAKISAQTAEYYTDLNKIMNLEAAKNYWKKDWLNIIAGKCYAFQAIAQMHQAQVNQIINFFFARK